jgi:hypothetical protein
MTFHFSFIGLANQFTMFAQRFQQVVPAKSCTEIEMLCYLGYRSASAAVAEYFTLIVTDIWFVTDSVDRKVLKHPFFRIYQVIA